MARKSTIGVWLIALALVPFRVTDAQQTKKVPRIGYLSALDPARESARTEAIRLAAMRELGYIEGQNIASEYRYADGKGNRQPELASELVRLYIIVPLVVFIIFILLFGIFQSVGHALLIMLNLPFALIGGTLALFLWGTNFNISAAVGYIAVFGVSVLNGVVLVSSIRQADERGFSYSEAIMRGCEIRFRPIIVSAIVAVIGFLPAALSHGIGAEIQRPLARVVIGGLISSTPLTLLVLPAVYELLSRRRGHSQETS
jgi:Cu/Ag efflux pump CusA